jgi:putative ATP-dependent endonuclease of the OLD family
MRAPFAVDLINTGRDLLQELGKRGSSIRKVLSDLEVPDGERSDLEDELTGLSQKILEESRTLQSVSRALQSLHNQIGTMGSPALSPLPGKLEELARLISIDLDTGSGGLPLRLHGSGTRSLASLQVQSVLYERRLGRDETTLSPTPVTLVEEPEAHLHPQAVQELGPLLRLLQGQKVVTTHSPQLVSHVDPRAIRLLRPGSHGLSLVDLGPASSDAAAPHRAFRPALHLEEMEKMKRLIERPFGELLFADAIVVGDGATERAFLPAIIRCALAHRAHGVCVVDPGSLGSEHGRAIVKFAHMTDTPWVALADGDKAGQEAVALLLPVGGGDKSRIVWVNGVDANGQPHAGAFEDMVHSFDAGLCRQACDTVRPDLSSEPVLTVMKKTKGAIGATLADLWVEKFPSPTQWPLPLQELTTRLGSELS